MEQSTEVEQNHQKSELSIPSTKSLLIRIDAIYIDLAGAMDNQQDASQCEHFSIRGYVAEMRKKDINVCLPFSTNGNQIETEEEKSTLPPIDVVKFKWWSCHNCLREIGAKCCAQEIGKVPNSLSSGFLSKGSCSIKEHLNDAVIRKSAPACTESDRDEILISSRGNGTGEKDNVGQSIVDGSENDAYQQILPVTKDIINSEPVLIPERHADGSDAIGRNISGNMDLCEPVFKDHISSNITPLESSRISSTIIGPTGTSDSPKGRNISGVMDLCEPSFRGHISSNIRPLESNRSSSLDIGRTGAPNSPKDVMGQKISGNKDLSKPSFRGHISSNISSRDIDRTGTSNSLKDQQRMESGDCEIMPKEGIASIEDIIATKGSTSITHSLDDFSSESSNGFSKDDDCDKFVESSSKLIRQRPPKVRLLTEILGLGGNVEINQSKTTDSDFDSASDFCDDIAVQTNPRQHAKRKRKITQFENGKPHLLPQKCQLSKGENANFAKRNCMVIDSETEESSGTFTKQKNLERHVSGKNKHKETRQDCNYPTLMPLPDVAKKYNLAATEEGTSRPAHHMYRNTNVDPYYTSSKSPLQAEQRSNMSKKIKPAGPIPQWNTMLGEGSFVRKDSDAYGRKGVDFSRNSYEATQRKKESHIAKAAIGAGPSFLPWNGTVRERCHQVKDGVFHSGESSIFRKTAPNLDSGKGLFYDLNEKIATQSPIRDMQNAIPQFGKRTIQHHRGLNMSGILNSELRNDDQDKGNEDKDIPMDIVELMAKNQYERQRHEFERNYFSAERTNEKRKFESMGFTRVHGNGFLKSYQVEDHNTRKPFPQTTTVKSNEHLAPMKVNPVNPLYIDENGLNVSKMDGKKSAFVRCNSFSNNQGTQASIVSYPGYGSVENGNYQNFQWRSDHIGSSFSPLVPNHTNFPQNYAPQASNFGTNSHTPEASIRGKRAQGLDLNFANEKYSNFEKQNTCVESLRKSSELNFVNEKYNNFKKQNRDLGVDFLGKSSDLNFVNEKNSNLEKKNWDFGVDSLRKPSAVDPFASKHRGIDLNAKVSGSIDLNSKEAIPAMQLLSLMDAGKNSYPLLNLDGKRKMTSKKPFSSCDYHPKVLDKPMFISDHDPKEPFGRDIGLSNNGSRPSSSKVLSKSSMFISDHDPKEPFGRDIGVSSKGSRPSSSKVLEKSFMFFSDDDPKELFGRDIGVSSNGSRPSSSKILDKSIFIADHDSQEPVGRDIGVSSIKSRPSSSTPYGKNQWRDKSCCPPPIPDFGSVASSFHSESSFKEGNGVPARVPPKIEEKKKGPAQNSTRKRQNPINRTNVPKNNQVSNSMQNRQRGNQHTSRTVSPLPKVSATDFCCVNRNPADFSIPEPENIFTITGRDLKFLKKISSRGKKRRIDQVPTFPET